MGAIITSSNNKIEVDYTIYTGLETHNGIAPAKKVYQKQNIEISLRHDGVVEAWINHLSQQLPLSFDGVAGTFKIQSINNIEPTDNIHLYELLKEII
jgi:hypothetical protein